MRCDALLRSTANLIGADFDSGSLPARAVQGARHNRATAGNRRLIATSKGGPATMTSQPFAAAHTEEIYALRPGKLSHYRNWSSVYRNSWRAVACAG